MGYAFISYEHESKDKANKIKSILNQNGIETWMDNDNLMAGVEFNEVIPNAIKDCSCYVVLLSSKSQMSDYVKKEFAFARDNNRPIIPIKLEDFEFEGFFGLHLSTVHVLTIPNLDESIEEIKAMVTAVKSFTDKDFDKEATVDVKITSTSTTKEAKSQKSSVFGMDRRLFTAMAVAVCAILLAIVVIIASSLSPLLKQNDTNNDFDKNYNTISSTISSMQEQTSGTTQDNVVSSTPQEQVPPVQSTLPSSSQEQASSEVVSTVPVGENQLSAEYDDDIEALKHSDSMSLSLRTLRIKVGGGVTPQSAQVWGNVTIYSQNTSIAVGDGLVVKGVAKGETYIAVKSNTTGMSQVYYVVVE